MPSSTSHSPKCTSREKNSKTSKPKISKLFSSQQLKGQPDVAGKQHLTYKLATVPPVPGVLLHSLKALNLLNFEDFCNNPILLFGEFVNVLKKDK